MGKNYLINKRLFTLVVICSLIIIPSMNGQVQHTAKPDTKKSTSNISIIPKPAELTIIDGSFTLASNFKIFNEVKGELAAKEIQSGFKKVFDIAPEIEKSSLNKNERGIYIRGNFSGVKNEEGYSLNIYTDSIVIAGASEAGAFYGAQSLIQIINSLTLGCKEIPCLKIVDYPRYSWRGTMLDESRHFFGADAVKKLLDAMAYYKLNRFQWHLTDEPGWRLEIKNYPKLTEIGATGVWEDSTYPPRFYTQAEAAEIIKYAAERFITIIPEIDMPGHATAANRAYPQFSGGGNKEHPEFTFHPVKEDTYNFLKEILRQTAELFPGEWLHTGGDEVHFGADKWSSDKEIAALMKKEKIEKVLDVQYYFEKRIENSLSALGKKNICWDEMVDANLDAGKTIIMWWRHDKPAQLEKALKKGFYAILTPRIPCYLDFVQDTRDSIGRLWQGRYCDLTSVYNGPAIADSVDKIYQDKILGVQASIWTEYINNTKRLEYSTYPRLFAFAEEAWTIPAQKNIYDFTTRLHSAINWLNEKGYYYYNPYNPTETPEPAGVKKKK